MKTDKSVNTNWTFEHLPDNNYSPDSDDDCCSGCWNVTFTTLLQTDDIAIALERMGHLAHKLTIYWIWKNNKPGTVWSGHCASLTWWWLWGCCCCCHWHKWICWRRWSYRWGRHRAFCWWWGWWTVCIPLQQCTAFFCQSISNTVPLWIHEVNIQIVALWEKEIKSTIVSIRDRSCFFSLKNF